MLPSVCYLDIIDRALREDLGSGDITTDVTVDEAARVQATAVARAALVVCGWDVFAAVFRRVDPSVDARRLVDEGTQVKAGTALWSVQGAARAILVAERVALNFAQRMCGVATRTRAYVDQLPPGCGVRIADTRKTTPGLRALERYAVRIGGGHNHRDDLASAILIKDNHIVAAGGIEQALQRARDRAPHTSRIEVEVANLDELERAMDAGADLVMLDNFDLAATREAVQRARGRVTIEVSGGVRIDQVALLARTGVNVISVGALTHSAPAADIALDTELIA